LKYQDKAQLCASQSQFTHLFYIAKVFPGWKIHLKSKSDVSFKSIPEGGWIGTIEYIIYENKKAKKMKKKDNSEVIVSWGITAEILRDTEAESEEKMADDVQAYSENNDGENFNKPAGAIIYKIDIEVFIE
jgi:hypothetical protein